MTFHEILIREIKSLEKKEQGEKIERRIPHAEQMERLSAMIPYHLVQTNHK